MNRYRNNWSEIAKGAYGEVFLSEESDKTKIVFKISTIAQRYKHLSDIPIRSSVSKCIISDIVNSHRLNCLSFSPNAQNYCENFPKTLTDSYVFEMDSESSLMRTEKIVSKQLYAGITLYEIEGFPPHLAKSIATQLICALAVAENAIQFEHRDLHYSNILINKTKDKYLNYSINANIFKLKSFGVKVTVIDNTFSRTKVNDSVIFNDLTETFRYIDHRPNDDLKEVYLKELKLIQNNWQNFYPKSNVYWVQMSLQYILNGIKTTDSEDNYCKEYEVIKCWNENINKYDSVLEFGEKFCKLFKSCRIEAKEDTKESEITKANVSEFEKMDTNNSTLEVETEPIAIPPKPKKCWCIRAIRKCWKQLKRICRN